MADSIAAIAISFADLHGRIADAAPKPSGTITIRRLAAHVFADWHPEFNRGTREAIVRRGIELQRALQEGQRVPLTLLVDAVRGRVVHPGVPDGVPPASRRVYFASPGGRPPYDILLPR